jgi:hypothetical protein
MAKQKGFLTALAEPLGEAAAQHRDGHPGASPTQLLTYDQDFIKLTAIYQRIESSQ